MREWRRVPADTLCGNCDVTIRVDEPAIYITLTGVKKPRIRCQACVGDAPPDLPLRPKTQPLAPSLESFRQTALGMTRSRVQAVAEATARMLGERE